MFRLWVKIWKDNRLLDDTVVENDERDTRTHKVLGGLEEGCDAVFMIGYHSRSQGRGILAHTINSFAFSRVFINGILQELMNV